MVELWAPSCQLLTHISSVCFLCLFSAFCPFWYDVSFTNLTRPAAACTVFVLVDLTSTQPFTSLGLVRFKKYTLLHQINTLLNWSKATVKTFIIIWQKISISNKCVWTFYSSKNLKNVSQFTQIISQHNFFDIDNKKCFLSTKLAYYNDFWRIMWHI